MSLLSARPHRVGGRYELEDLLGRGGMADVYRAHDDVLDRPVAVKVLRDVAATHRFRAEARTLGRLTHPGLVTVLDAGVSDGRPWLVMELVKGETLADRCARGPVPPEEVAVVGRRLAAALAHVHGSGLVHRDVKPGNVLLADDGRVLLTDFGIARLVEGAATMTATGLTMGTAAYLAPEQVRGEPLSPAADVYALGLVLLEALTGRRAFPGAATEAALARLARSPEVPASLPQRWQQLLAGMTADEPSSRPSLEHVGRELRLLAAADAAGARTVPLRPAQAARPSGSPTVALATPAQQGPATWPLTRAHAGAEPARARSRRAWLAAVAHAVRPHARLLLAVVAASFLVVALLLVPRGGTAGSPPPRVPGGVQSPFQADLQELHQAVDGR